MRLSDRRTASCRTNEGIIVSEAFSVQKPWPWCGGLLKQTCNVLLGFLVRLNSFSIGWKLILNLFTQIQWLLFQSKNFYLFVVSEHDGKEIREREKERGFDWSVQKKRKKKEKKSMGMFQLEIIVLWLMYGFLVNYRQVVSTIFLVFNLFIGEEKHTLYRFFVDNTVAG